MLFSSFKLIKDFYRSVVYPNRWKYLALIAVCFLYVFGLSIVGPKSYTADATLVFKNLSDAEYFDKDRPSNLPLPIFVDETPIETQYDYSELFYSIYMAQQAIGDRFDEIYDPEEFDGVLDFYETFLTQAGFEYDGETKTLRISFTYKDPELAAEFCNGMAKGLENYLIKSVQAGTFTYALRQRIAQARIEAENADKELLALSQKYEIPDLLEAPKEWVAEYGDARRESAQSEIKLESALAAVNQIRSARERRNLLVEPESPPDTTIIQDIILAALRFKLALLKSAYTISGEAVPPESPQREQLASDIAYISQYIEGLYKSGLDVEENALILEFEKFFVEDYINSRRVEAAFEKISDLPEIEKVIRPVVRKSNSANATVITLEKLENYTVIGEEYENIPLLVVDYASPPENPNQPAWNTLAYLLPTALFLATLWFMLAERIRREAVSIY